MIQNVTKYLKLYVVNYNTIFISLHFFYLLTKCLNNIYFIYLKIYLGNNNKNVFFFSIISISINNILNYNNINKTLVLRNKY